MSLPTWRSSSTHRISSRSTPGMGVKAEPSPDRIDGEAGVVLRQIDVAEESVGRLDVGYAGELELLDQTILQRCERPLGAASRLRRIGADMLDPELAQRPSDLSR